jgi:hypothetical protein
VAIESAKPLISAEVDTGTDEFEGQSRVSEFVAYGKTFDLGKPAEIPQSQTACRFVANIANEMGSSQVVAVELLVIWAILFRDVDRAPDRYDPHQILERTGDGYGHTAVVARRVMTIVGGFKFLARVSSGVII